MSFGDHNHAFVTNLAQRNLHTYNLRNRAPHQNPINEGNNNRGRQNTSPPENRQNTSPPENRQNQRNNQPPNDPPENVNNQNAERQSQNTARDANIQTSPPGISPVFASTNINRPIPNDPRENFFNHYRPHFRNSSTPVNLHPPLSGYDRYESTTIGAGNPVPDIDRIREERNRLEEQIRAYEENNAEALTLSRSAWVVEDQLQSNHSPETTLRTNVKTT